MRIALTALALAAGLAPAVLTMPATAQSNGGDLTSQLSACRSAGISRDECLRKLRQPQLRPMPSKPVVRQSQSKYPPVPQDGSGQNQGPYVNQQ